MNDGEKGQRTVVTSEFTKDPRTTSRDEPPGAHLRMVWRPPGRTAHSRAANRRGAGVAWDVPVVSRGVSTIDRGATEVIISLTRGKTTVIDDESSELVAPFKWHAHLSPSGTWYARTTVPVAIPESDVVKRITLGMHRLILNAGPGEMVDHWDGDGLNNQRQNLRMCTRSQNRENTRRRKKSASGFIGVRIDRRCERFQAIIGVNGQQIHLGMFGSPIEAALAYNLAAIRYFGEFAQINQMDGRR